MLHWLSAVYDMEKVIGDDRASEGFVHTLCNHLTVVQPELDCTGSVSSLVVVAIVGSMVPFDLLLAERAISITRPSRNRGHNIVQVQGKRAETHLLSLLRTNLGLIPTSTGNWRS